MAQSHAHQGPTSRDEKSFLYTSLEGGMIRIPEKAFLKMKTIMYMVEKLAANPAATFRFAFRVKDSCLGLGIRI